MSGPKVSVYTLSREVRLALQREMERQLRERERQLREEQERERARQLALQKERERARLHKLDQEQQKIILGDGFSSLFATDDTALGSEAPDEETYREALRQYEILCQQTGNRKPALVAFGPQAVEQLQQEIQKEKKCLLRQKEEQYIQDTLEQTLQDMGYAVLGNRQAARRSGQKVRHELYQYGEDTAIDVTYGENGQIALELGKLDQKDRLPSAEECQYLENQMTAFCGDFKDLEARLQEKGIFLGKRVLLAPPSADFAQVINQAEYTASAPGQVAEKRQQKKKQYDILK